LNELLDDCHDLIDNIIDGTPSLGAEKKQREKLGGDSGSASEKEKQFPFAQGTKLEMPQNIPQFGNKQSMGIPESHLKHEPAAMKRGQFEKPGQKII
jgi:hypothetical protein